MSVSNQLSNFREMLGVKLEKPNPVEISPYSSAIQVQNSNDNLNFQFKTSKMEIKVEINLITMI